MDREEIGKFKVSCLGYNAPVSFNAIVLFLAGAPDTSPVVVRVLVTNLKLALAFRTGRTVPRAEQATSSQAILC